MAMPPHMGGGSMIFDVTKEFVTYADPPHRFEAGTPPIVQAIGLGVALTYMEGIGRERIAMHEGSLRDYAHERLARINGLRIYGTTKNKGAIVPFSMEGVHTHDISTIVDREGVAVRAGTHCAQPLLARYGTAATCRASFGLYNTLDEVDRRWTAPSIPKRSSTRSARGMLAMVGGDAERLTFIPVAALGGENVVHHSPHMPWYTGPTLFEALEEIEIADGQLGLPLRMPVQALYPGKNGEQLVVGRIESGALRVDSGWPSPPAVPRRR